MPPIYTDEKRPPKTSNPIVAAQKAGARLRINHQQQPVIDFQPIGEKKDEYYARVGEYLRDEWGVPASAFDADQQRIALTGEAAMNLKKLWHREHPFTTAYHAGAVFTASPGDNATLAIQFPTEGRKASKEYINLQRFLELNYKVGPSASNGETKTITLRYDDAQKAIKWLTQNLPEAIPSLAPQVPDEKPVKRVRHSVHQGRSVSRTKAPISTTPISDFLQQLTEVSDALGADNISPMARTQKILGIRAALSALDSTVEKNTPEQELLQQQLTDCTETEWPTIGKTLVTSMLQNASIQGGVAFHKTTRGDGFNFTFVKPDNVSWGQWREKAEAINQLLSVLLSSADQAPKIKLNNNGNRALITELAPSMLSTIESLRAQPSLAVG